MEEPVRERPDYGEAPFEAGELAEELEERVAARLVEDYRDGAFAEVPLGPEALGDVLSALGVAGWAGEPRRLRSLARRVNRRLAGVEARRMVSSGALPARLAAEFGRAVREGRVPRLEVYSRAQVAEFVAAVVGDGPEVGALARSVALAHNVAGDGGVMEVEGGPALLSGDEMVLVRAYMGRVGDWSVELDARGASFYPTGDQTDARMWEVVRMIGREFRGVSATVRDEGTPLAHVRVDEGGEPQDFPRDYPGMV